MNARLALREVPIGPARGEVGLLGRNLGDNRDPVFPFPFGTFLLSDGFQLARTYGVDFLVRY